MLKFSANLSMLFTERPLIERFAAAKKAGFNAVEIQFPYELSIEEIQQQLVQHDLPLVLINVPAGDLMAGGNGLACVPGQEDNFQEALELACDYAAALKVPVVNILAGRQPDGVTATDCLATLQHNLKKSVQSFSAIGVTPVAEAINSFDMPGFFIHSIHDLQQLCKKIPGLKMQLDCYHIARMGNDVMSTLKDNLALTAHIQFADAPNRHEPGRGSLDFSSIFSFLRNSDYAGWTGAEYRPSKTTEETLHWLSRWQQ